MVPHNRPTIGDEEKAAAVRVLECGCLSQGAEVEAFEDELCAFLGLPSGHAVALSSGTASLFMALWVLGAVGKTVAFPVYACSALRNAVAMARGSERLLDIADRGPNIVAADLARCNAEIAIVPHLFGLPVDLSERPTVTIVEDCAQAIGASSNGTPVGLQAEIGVFSFYATKVITSGGQGGMLVSREKAIADSVRDFRDFDYRRDRRKRFNFQMTELQAAIGRVQLRRLPSFLARRDEIFARYVEAGIPLMDSVGRNKPIRYRAILRNAAPKETIKRLDRMGIKAIVPVEDWELLGEASDFPNAFQLTRESISLPLYPSLRNDAVDTIIQTLSTK